MRSQKLPTLVTESLGGGCVCTTNWPLHFSVLVIESNQVNTSKDRHSDASNVDFDAADFSELG